MRCQEEKIAELEKLHRSLRDKRQADRLKAVIALSKGWSAVQVVEILLFDEKTSRRYFEFYNNERLHQALGYRSPAYLPKVLFCAVCESADPKQSFNIHIPLE